MTTNEIFGIAGGVAIQIVGVIIWLVRLEGRVNYSEKKVDSLQIEHDALNGKIASELIMLREALARIEGYLKAKG